MSIEVATYINDLQATNPPSTDPRSQGDDHLRLIKSVLQNTFGGATRQWQFPSFSSFSVTTTITKAMGENECFVNTGAGAVTLTLPTLAAADAGWRIFFTKYSTDTNPIFVVNPGGNIYSGPSVVAKARRCIPGVRISVFWTGATYVVSRALAIPIGSLIDYYGSSLPAGFEWPNGQTLSSAVNYPEYNTIMGNLATPDLRGYVCATLDNLGGSSAGRLPSGIITPTSVGNVGGVDAVVLNVSQMPSHYHGCTLSDPGHSHAVTGGSVIGIGSYNNFGSGVGITAPNGAATLGISSSTTGAFITSSTNGNNTTYSSGNSLSHSNLQPTIMVGKLLVVE